MALVEEKYTESTDGIRKTIDKNSMGMALDILQRGLYAHPIESTIRELASNGYDAIKERNVAREIILGTTKVEDHFDVTKIDGIFHASGWDPSYFDLNWLSTDSHTYLYYEEGTLKDTLRIVDHGVGLGKTRLVNYFMLNWSSKRANKDSLGRFGLGSKVALSLGVDSFRVITKYNGRKFKFDVFLDKVESIIPKFSTKGQANEPFILVPEKSFIEEDGTTTVIPPYIAYCEVTPDMNGVEIQIEVKKHNKKLFFDAIKAQLMYMPDIKLMHKELNQVSYVDIPIAAEVLYRDEHVIISKSTVFDKPHVLLGTGNALINYGFVSFKDLEIEPKRGSVGLIMDINDIEVTPSRESPMWTAKTRAAVLAKYKRVSEMASVYLNKELSSETDYLKWISKAAQIIGSMRQGGSNSSVLSRLASIIDMDDIGSVAYPCDNRIIFDPKVKTMFGDTLTVRTVKYNSYSHSVERKNLEDLGYLTRHVYFTTAGSNSYRDRYLYEEFSDFILINVKADAVPDTLGNFVMTSSLLLDYDSIVIPQDRMDLYLSEADGIGEDDGSTASKAALSVDWAGKRKANKQIPMHILSGTGNTYDYKFTSEDMYITELYSKFSDKLVVYTTGGDREALSNLLAIFPTRMLSLYSAYDFNEFTAECTHMPLATPNRIIGVLLAAENVKYVKNSTKYLSQSDLVVKNYNVKTGQLAFSDLIKFAATNSVLNTLFRDKFYKIDRKICSKHIKTVLPEFYKLVKFFDNNYRTYKPPTDLMHKHGFLRNAILIQLYKEKILDASDETIEDLFKEINTQVPDSLCDVIDVIEDIDILNVDIIHKVVKVFDYYSKHNFLLHLVSSFNDYDTSSIEAMKPEIIQYFKYANNELT